jgi:lysylphosphatidylglycerol synthetase-like protein (DUF2156 family)
VRNELRCDPPVPGGFGFPLGAALGVLVTIVTVAVGATGHPDLAVLPLAVSVAALAVLTTPAATVGASVLYWFLVAGFVIGREGQVSLDSTSMFAAAVLVLTAVACVTVTVAVRWVLAAHHRVPAVQHVVRVERAGAGLPG